MPAFKEIPRSAFVAWSPAESRKSLLVLGGRGVNAQLDFVDINLADPNRTGYEIPVSVDLGGTPVRCLSWALSEDSANLPLGYIAAGFDSGIVKLWNPNEFLNAGHKDSMGAGRPIIVQENAGRSLVATVKYDKPVTCLSFNPIRPILIACGYEDGMLNIVNIDNPKLPEIYEPGTEPVKAHGKSSVTAVAWNKTVQHILASTCSNGSTTIWNLRQRKPSIKFRDPAGRLRPSSVAWLPNQATQVVVAYDDDTNPSFQMWDLRNSSFPFKEFPGHTRGIVDIQFCDLDPMLMLSSGKDNRVVCWALEDGGVAPIIYSELSTVEWQDNVRWSPCLPGLIAASSHIEGVVVESIQERQSLSTKHVPRWYKRSAGVSFAFGGKLVSFNETAGTLIRCDVISSTDADLIRQADEFETTLVNGDYLGYCERRIAESEDEHEKLTWQVVQTLFYSPEQRSTALLDKLGFKVQNVLSSVEAFLGYKPGQIFQDDSTPQQLGHDGTISSNECLDRMGIHGRMINGLYDQSTVQEMLNQSVDAESFFNNLEEKSVKEADNEWVPSVTQSGAGSGIKTGYDLDEIGTRVGQCTVGSKIRPEGSSVEMRDYSSGSDLLIKTSMLIGHRSVAVEMCMKSERWADALLLAATSGGSTLWEKTQNLYLKRRSNDKFMQMVGCIISANWDELVRLADLSKWEETLAVLASYVPLGQFQTLASELGLRLERDRFDIRAAVVCYLAAGDFTHAASIWSTLSVSGNRGKSLQKGLQDLVEKLAVLKKATNYEFDDPLFNQKVSQYAEVLANSGRLVAGMKFLCLVGSESNDPRNSTGILRDRIYNASPEAMQEAGIPSPGSLPFTHIEVMAALPSSQPQQQAPRYGGIQQQSLPYQQQQPQLFRPEPSYSNIQQQQTPSPYGIPPASAQPPASIPHPPVSPWLQPQPPSTTIARPPQPSARPPMPTTPGYPPTASHQPMPVDVTACFGHPSAAAARPPTGPSPFGGPPATAASMMPLIRQPPPFSQRPPPFGSTPQSITSICPPQQQPGVHATPMVPINPSLQFPPISASPAIRPQMTNGFIPQQQMITGPPPQPLRSNDLSMQGGSSTYDAPPPPAKSTAPTAGVVNLPSGMPVPWPIPTGTQQVGSTTQSTAPANQKIQSTATSKGESLPMSPTDVAFIQRIVFGAHSHFSQHDTSGGRESEKLRQTLNEMIIQLQSGGIAKQIQDLVLQYCRAMEVGDLTAASQIQSQMVKTAWTKESRLWLPSLKRIMIK